VYVDWNGYDSESSLRLCEKAEKIARGASIELIHITTNIVTELYARAHAPIVSSMVAACALAVSRLIGVFYYSSAYDVGDFRIDEKDANNYELLTSTCFSTELLSMYVIGLDVTRIEKIAEITKHPSTAQTLAVCVSPHQEKGNCSRCSKCTRTMAELDALGRLEDYVDLFDVEHFKNHPAYHLGFVLLKRKDKFYSEILDQYRFSGKHLPISAYFGAFFKWMRRRFSASAPSFKEVLSELREVKSLK
jgi:hypothetical protein